MKKEVQPEEQSVRKSQRIKSQKRANQDSQAKSAPIKTRSGDKSLQLRLKKRSEKLAKQEKQMKYSVSRQYKLARLNRSKRQRIFLMQAERRDDRWEFVVEGTTGNNYRVLVSTQQLKCGCLDFRLRKKTCKHLYFIITQVAQNDELTKRINTNPKISQNAYNLLDMQLTQRLRSRIQQHAEKKNQEGKTELNITFGEDDTCAICFDELKKEDLAQCALGCKKYFHETCMQRWLAKN